MLKDKISIETKEKYWGLRTRFLNVLRRIRRAPGKMARRWKRKIVRFFRRGPRKLIRWFRRGPRRVWRQIKRTPRKILKILFSPAKWKSSFELMLRKMRRDKEIALRNSMYREGFLEKLMPVLDEMPVSNGSRYYEKLKVKIAIVADEFLYDSFKDIAEFIYVRPDNYRDYIDQVDFFLVASAWRGLNNEWRVMGTEGTENNRIIHEAIEAYKKAGKTVVFYSKEDPPNYEHFLPIAQKCDVIFTSCAEKVEDYKLDCKTDRVYVMEFCINPVFHNPIGMRNEKRTDGVFFAGSWMLKYPERVQALETMLDAVLQSGKELVIADRNFSQDNIVYFFPQKYYSYITKEIPHDYLQKVHKLYNWAININSITESETMFANRVYELQANGCLMLSNRSIGVQKKFKEVIIVESKEDVTAALKRYTPEEVYEHQIAGVRRVMTGETNYDRIMKLLDAVDMKVSRIERKVLVVAEHVTPQLQKAFDAQTYKNKKLVELSELTEELYQQFDMVTRWDEQSVYGKHYLEDMINGFKYTSCDYITKDCYRKNGELVGSVEHDYVEKVSNVYATVVWRASMDMTAFLSMKDGMKLENGYSIDRFEYEV